MAYLEIPLFTIKSSEMAQILQQIQWALNTLTKDNFPNKLNATDILTQGSVTDSLIHDHSVTLKKLNWLEWPIPLVIPAQPVSTTDSLDCGGFFLYDPAKFPGGNWYLEATMKIDPAGGTATAQLKNDTVVIGSVSIDDNVWTIARSDALVLPPTQASLTVTLTSSNASYTAYLWSARLIYVA